MRSTTPAHCALAAALTALTLTPAAHATTVIRLVASQDATIFATAAGADTGNASGAGPGLFAGADSAGNLKRSLVQFDLSAVPAHAQVTGVLLAMTLAQAAGSGEGGAPSGGPRGIGIYALQQGWTEGASGGPAGATIGGTGQGAPRGDGDVTWDDASYRTNPAQAARWGQGASPGGAFSTPPSATTWVSSFDLDAPVYWSTRGMNLAVQSWVDDPSSNQGWLLKSDLEATPASYLAFWSKEGAAANGQAGWAPTLTVFYEAAPVPEPTTLALFGAGLTLLLGVRRRPAA